MVNGLKAIIITICFFSCTQGKKNTIEQPDKKLNSVVINSIDLNRKLDRAPIEELDSEQLRLLRNEIFARKGYKFKSEELSIYFEKFNWYIPRFDKIDIENDFSEFEKFNISLIREIERELEEKESLDRKRKEIYENLTFSDYVIALPDILLPTNFDCKLGFKTTGSKMRNDTINKFKPDGAGVVGKFYADKDGVSILYTYPADIVYPIIEYYDLNGNKTGSHRLFKLSECINHFDYSAFTRGLIQPDFSVTMETTIIECDLESEDTKCDTTSYSQSFSIK